MQPLEAAVYVHLAWATWERAPLITAGMERDMHRGIAAACEALKARVIALGGVEDHVHLLVQLPSALSVADLMRHVKGSSAHLATHVLAPATFFKWQPGYGSVSVSPRHLAQVSDYIVRQREHHAAGSLVPLLEHTNRDISHERR